jgi:hypothetical protein
MSPALLPTMPLAELDSLRRQLDQAYERWFDGESFRLSTRRSR